MCENILENAQVYLEGVEIVETHRAGRGRVRETSMAFDAQSLHGDSPSWDNL